jgi:hypothetical protein
MDLRNQPHQSYRSLLKPREAMTIAVHCQVSPSVVDTTIVAATRRAAQLFGYTDAAELEGRFTSMVHLLEDIQRTRLRSTLRALGLGAPTDDYEIRLLQASGRIQRVLKHVEQREMHDTIVWVCYHEPADERQPFAPPPIPHSVPEEALHQYFGWACVAEVEAMLRQQRLLLTGIHDLSIFRQIKVDAMAGVATALSTTDERTIARLAIQSLRPHYRCRCLVCGRDWITSGEEGAADDAFMPPSRCNYADCRSYVWNDPIAAPAARRKRAQRLARQHRPSSE